MTTWASIKKWPDYPADFVAEGHPTLHTVTNTAVLTQLRQAHPGSWSKVYLDGWCGDRRVSIHYFKHTSGAVALAKVKMDHWSNS